MKTRKKQMKLKTKSKTKSKSNRKILIIAIGVVVLLLIAVACGLSYSLKKYEGETCWIKIHVPTEAALKDSLISNLGSDYGLRVYQMWYIMGGNVETSQGAYKVEPGISAFSLGKAIKNNHQTPVRVVFNNVRTMDLLAEKISRNMMFDKEDFLKACDDVLLAEGLKKEEFPSAFFPDTYEFYWNASPQKVVMRLLDYYKKFWTEERVAKAAELGLTPVQVSTIASIVEEETNKADERPKVARLYLNRLKKGMKLQADPTIKFGLGDFSLRRITLEHLKVESPYNTYKYKGLPPGPIRVVSKSTLEGVLNAPKHNYLYMCAKEDFSGYHNFAENYDTHLANARRYQAELNKRNIK